MPTELGVDALRLAMAVVRPGNGPRRVASELRQHGIRAAFGIYEQLSDSERDDVERDALKLETAGARAVLLGQSGYPPLLASLRQAPPVLFCLGSASVLETTSIGVCGSREASLQGLAAARACGEEIAGYGLSIVSGYARGVDAEAHAAALDAACSTTMVLPEGIARYKPRSWLSSRSYDPAQVAVVSQFPPGQTWSAGAAMSRNSVIIGLSLALVVIESGETGGTLAAGRQALNEKRPVITLEFRKDMPAGNKILLDQGAIPVRNREQLRTLLRQIVAGSQPGQQTLI